MPDRRHASIRGWVLIVARRAVSNVVRFESRRSGPGGPLSIRDEEPACRDADSVLDLLERSESIARVLLALGRLRDVVPERNYRIFVRRHIDGCNAATIAAEIGVRPSLVFSIDRRVAEKFLTLICQRVARGGVRKMAEPVDECSRPPVYSVSEPIADPSDPPPQQLQ